LIACRAVFSKLMRAFDVTSPANVMPLEDNNLSTATRPLGSCASISSNMLSLIKSAILSGWPALTDSLVNNFIISPSFVLISFDIRLVSCYNGFTIKQKGGNYDD